MQTDRLTAFSDGVIAIIITIMVLELKAPHGDDPSALVGLIPVFLSYVLSFLYIAIYWNNHHHLMHAAQKVDGAVLWANMLLLFWLSLVPFATAWMGENDFARWPTVLYGVTLLMPAIAYYLLKLALLRLEDEQGLLSTALGDDLKGKISPLLYLVAIGVAYFQPWIAHCIYVAVALMWLIPDRRIEREVERQEEEQGAKG